MNWLGQVIWGFIRGLLGHAQEQAEKPKPITYAETPPAKLEQFQDDIEAFKKRKNDEEARNHPKP